LIVEGSLIGGSVTKLLRVRMAQACVREHISLKYVRLPPGYWRKGIPA
jgi:hypothetical protein